MINYSCSSVLVNDQDTKLCDLNNSCLNIGDVLSTTVNALFTGTCSLYSIVTSGNDGENNYIVISGTHCELDTTTIAISDPCIISGAYTNPYIIDVVACGYDAETDQTTLSLPAGSKSVIFGSCPADCETCGVILETCNTSVTMTITNTTTGQHVYSNTWLNQNVDEVIDYTILNYGNYHVAIEYINCNGTDCAESALCEFDFKACPFYKIVTDSCHHYTAYDLSPFSKTNYVNVQGVNGYSETYEFTVPYEDHVSFTTPSDGVYTATITHDNYGPCTGTCVNNNGNFDTNLNWWCNYIGFNINPYSGSTYCDDGMSAFIWNSGHALYNQPYNGTRGGILQQSCLTIDKTYCVNFDITNLNTLVSGSYDTTTVQVYAGDTLITSSQMPSLYFQDITSTTHHIYIPAITCTNTTNPLNNWFSIQVINGGTVHPLSVVYIDNVCIREVTLVPELQESYTQVIYDLCDMAACIKKLILDLFCNENDPCCNDCDPAKQKQKELYRNELNKLNALYSTFSMMIAKEQADYLNVFTMDSCREMMIAEIQSVFTKINEITKRCGDCDPKTNVTTPSSGCNGC